MKGNKTDLKTLARHKTVTRARLDSLGRLHQETFPVAYADGATVYYKIPGKPGLVEAPLWGILPDLPVALVMEKCKAGDPDAWTLYWNPAPKERISALSTCFETTAMSAAVEKAKADELNSRQHETYWVSRHNKEANVLAMRRTELRQSRKLWKARLEAQSKAIFDAIATHGPLPATFVHSGENLGEKDEVLRTFNYEKAEVLSAKPDLGQTFGRYCLACGIRFPGWPKSTFTVPDYTLIDLYEHYPEYGEPDKE